MIIVKLVIRIIAYSTLIATNAVWAIDSYNQGREVMTILWGTSTVIWLVNLILILSFVIKVGEVAK